MIAFVVVASLVAALVNAVAIVMQRRAAGVRLPHELFQYKMFMSIAKKRLWLTSVGLQLVGFLLQAIALNWGSLVLVEPIMAMVLVFLFLILHYRYNILAGKREWFAVGAVCVGLIAMLTAARPHGGHLSYSAPEWALTIGIITAVIFTCIVVVRRSDSPKTRAAVGGIAAAANIGLTAGLTKLVLEKFNENPLGLLVSWELYIIIASGLLMVVVLQSVFAAGPLVISQPIIEIVNPIVSSLIGIIIFHNIINTSPAAVAIALPGLALAVAGLALIGSSKRYEKAHVT